MNRGSWKRPHFYYEVNIIKFSDITAPVEKDLKKVDFIINSALVSNFKIINEISSYVFESGGKKIRPALLLLSCALFKKPGVKTVKMAAGAEIIHNATLVHDDIIDNALIRRSKESLNNKYGNTIAVLFGDFLYCQAFKILSEYGEEFVARNFLVAAGAMCEGEIFQSAHVYDPDISLKDYYRIIESKTAKFLAACSSIGAYCGGASKTDIENMRKFGLNLGMAFQIADDVLDISSSDKIIGKPSGKDLREGKITLPVIILLEKMGKSSVNKIKDKIRNKSGLDQNFIEDIICLSKKNHVIEESLEIAMNYVKKSFLYLKKTSPENHIKDKLRLFAEFMALRQK